MANKVIKEDHGSIFDKKLICDDEIFIVQHIDGDVVFDEFKTASLYDAELIYESLPIDP